MIPKIIHYCWFGRAEKTKLAKKCIASWRKYCPDYKIIEWNEDNFDVHSHSYAQYCYENKKWAFLSDYVRLAVVAQNGGIYFDTDVEVVKPLDNLLQFEAFFGFENTTHINTGEGFGAVAGHQTVKAMLSEYREIKISENGDYPLISCPHLNTQALVKFGLLLNGKQQHIAEAEILPTECLNPYDDSTGILHITEKTYSIHWYSKSWLSRTTVLRSHMSRPIHRIFGKDCFLKWKKKLK